MTTAHGGHHTTTSTWSTALQKTAAVIGTVFVLVGILGFIPGATSNFDQLGAAGVGSQAMLLGVFQVSVLHNLVHLALGIAGITMSRTSSGARAFLVGGGVIYLVVWLYGLLIDKTSTANFLPVNMADDWLHLVMGAGMVALGLVLGNRGANRDARQS